MQRKIESYITRTSHIILFGESEVLSSLEFISFQDDWIRIAFIMDQIVLYHLIFCRNVELNMHLLELFG